MKNGKYKVILWKRDGSRLRYECNGTDSQRYLIKRAEFDPEVYRIDASVVMEDIEGEMVK